MTSEPIAIHENIVILMPATLIPSATTSRELKAASGLVVILN